jgi:hypothetical protein
MGWPAATWASPTVRSGAGGPAEDASARSLARARSARDGRRDARARRPLTPKPNRPCRPAYDALRKQRGDTAIETLTARRHLADLYDRWSRPQQADSYRN